MRGNDDLLWVGVDLDKTLAHSEYPDFTLLEPLEGAREAMRAIEARGFKPTVYTARPWVDYEKIEEWLRHHDIVHRRIICGKPLFKYMIDDRNIAFDGDWQKALEKII